jgi:hypothetical protein
MPEPELQSELTALGLQFGDQVTKAIQGHLVKCKVSIEQDLLKLDSREADRALEIADKQLRSKMGNKLTDADKKTWLTEAKQLLGTPREGIPKVTETAKAPETVKPLGKGKAPANPNPKPNPNPANPNPKPNPAVELYQFSDLRGGTPGKKRKFSPGKASQVSSNESSQEISSDDDTFSISDVLTSPIGTDMTDSTTGKKTVSIHSNEVIEKYVINIKHNCKILILGDSTLEGMPVLPEQFQIECFRNAKLAYLRRIVERSGPAPKSLKHICIAGSFQDTAVIDRFLKSTDKYGAAYTFLVKATPEDATAEEKEMINDYNADVFCAVDEEVNLIGLPHGYKLYKTPHGKQYDEPSLQELAKCFIRAFSD